MSKYTVTIHLDIHPESDIIGSDQNVPEDIADHMRLLLMDCTDLTDFTIEVEES